MDRQQALEKLREAIQEAEQFGLVRDENGKPLTGVVDTKDGFVITQD